MLPGYPPSQAFRPPKGETVQLKLKMDMGHLKNRRPLTKQPGAPGGSKARCIKQTHVSFVKVPMEPGREPDSVLEEKSMVVSEGSPAPKSAGSDPVSPLLFRDSPLQFPEYIRHYKQSDRKLGTYVTSDWSSLQVTP